MLVSTLSRLPLGLLCVLFFLEPPHGVLGAPRTDVVPAIAPDPIAGGPVATRTTIDLKRRRSLLPASRSPFELARWAKRQRAGVIAKYGLQDARSPRREGEEESAGKRALGENLIVDLGFDSCFYGTLAIGTPAYSYAVILDTGSADLWIASSNCGPTCVGTGNYNAEMSTTFKSLGRNFSVAYGSGYAKGALVQDVVQMAGFSVANQKFGSVTSTSNNFLQNPVVGLIGLGWRSLSSTGATPFWQTLASGGYWDSPVMAFQLTRYINATNAGSLEPGGSVTMGYVNESLYTGEIDYRSIPGSQPSYWTQQITSMTVQGKSISLSNGSASYAAIDTGTTLVAGPTSAIAAIYAQIPGSAPATGQWQGFYSYPCTQEVKVEISFGGPSWPISPADFQYQPTGSESDNCYGAFYSIPTAANSPQWIIGDTFLKNVYSVFRYDPPSVGFAALSEAALAMNGVNAVIPSATIGASVASVTNGAGAGQWRQPLGHGGGRSAAVMIGGPVLLSSFVVFGLS